MTHYPFSGGITKVCPVHNGGHNGRDVKIEFTVPFSECPLCANLPRALKCGTESSYSSGCRCQLCTTAHAVYNKKTYKIRTTLKKNRLYGQHTKQSI